LAIPDPLGLAAKEERSPDVGIARGPTARVAFIGRTLRGPLHRPRLARNFAEFQQLFGGLWQPSPLSYAIEHFFDNGGREALVVRVANGARSSTLSLPAGRGALTLEALSPGTREFLRASVDYDNVPAQDVQRFNLTVQRVRVPGGNHVEDQEIFALLSLDPADERFLARALERSDLVRIKGDLPAERPDRTWDSERGVASYIASSGDGDDGAPLTDYDIVGSEIERTGLFALEGVQFNFLCIPPLTREIDVGPCAWLAAIRYCLKRRALLIIDPPAGWHTADEALRALRDFNYCSEHALMYFPRLLAHDKLRGHFESFAPSGAVAGLIARSDDSGPLWAAGRTEEAVLRPGYRPACLVSEDRRSRLEQKGVNTLQAVRSVARIGVRARTLAAGTAPSADAQNLAARRFALLVVNSIEQGTRWVRGVAALGEEHLARVRSEARLFLESLHAEGAFGARPLGESFFVRVSLLEGQERALQILVSFAGTARRPDLHGYRIVQRPTGSEVRVASLDRRQLLEYCPEELEWVERLASQLKA
jgi:hypothetical protein